MTLHPGMRVVAVREESCWRTHFETRLVRVRALWRWVASEECGENAALTYLGEIQYRGRKQHVAEVLPGELLCLQAPVTADHLAFGTVNSLEGGLRVGERVTELSKGPFWVEGSVRFRASRLRVANTTVSGVIVAHNPTQGELQGVKIGVWDIDDTYVTVRRQFIVSAPILQALRDSVTEEERFQHELKEYLESPTNLDILVRHGPEGDAVQLQRFRLPKGGGKGWTSVVDIGTGEGPYLAGIPYPSEGVVRVFETSEGFRGSFRKAPPLSPDEYREGVLGVSIDESIVLTERLFYVGAEPAFPDLHRFEWRFGCTLVARESELLFDGDAFSNARGVLFPGDSITRVQFLRGTDGNSCVIAIEQVNVEISETTALYRQRSESRVVHLLNLEYVDDEIRILSVIGCTEASSDEFTVFERLRSAHLDFADQAALLAGRGRERQKAVERETILGRLDGEHFLNTLGQEVVFRHVLMAFAPSPSIHGRMLEEGELIFMTAGLISPVKNDAVLELLPHARLRIPDIGPEWQNCGVLRRRYSVRDDLLLQLLQRRGRNACQGTIYLVRVNVGRDRIHASVIDGPPRRARALMAAIDDSRAPLLATIIGVHGSKLRLELQPGLFFSLPFDRFVYREADFSRGTLVRVQRSKDRAGRQFHLIRAAMSDEHYVPAGGRPAIALPKNVLLREVPHRSIVSQAKFWEGAESARSKSFTIAGLPGIEAVPGSVYGNPPKWSSPDPREFAAMLQRRHPDRAVLLGRDDRDFRIAPLKSTLYLEGSLAIDDVPVFKPTRVSEDLPQQTIPWTSISFLDGSIADIKDHARAHAWRVHDTHSASWRDGKIEWESLKEHSVESGPLLASCRNGHVHLRFGEQDFTTFGYPVQELLDCLAGRTNRTGSFPVAGLSAGGGLWIELAPGRISELPGQLMTMEVAGREISISTWAWRTFSAGDQVVLRLAFDSASRVDRIVLKEWRPTARGVLGAGRCFLPIIEHDAIRGGLKVGAGQITCALPSRDPVAAERGIFLSNNEFLPASNQYPATGDTVLIGIENGSPVVHGMPGIVPMPDRERDGSRASDPLADEIKRNYATVISALGGALPVTVEAFVPKNSILYFSRRKQKAESFITPGTVSEASVLGLVSHSVLLRCGSEILKAPLNDVLPGIPLPLGEKAIHELKTLGQTVWIRRTEDKLALSFGISDESSRQFLVEGVCSIAGDDRQRPTAGIVCRSTASLSLHWLPQDEFAWVELSAKELAEAINTRRTFSVRALYEGRPGPVTVTGVLTIRREFDRLAPGTTFDATLVSPRSEASETKTVRWLANVSSINVLLECEIPQAYDVDLAPSVRLEVSYRTRGPLSTIAAALLGSRKYSLDLPSWISNTDSNRIPDELRTRRLWHDEVISADVLNNPSEDLDRKVIHVWRSLKDGDLSAPRANLEYALARSWINQNLRRSEMDPAVAIMVVLILFRNGHANVKALATETGGREHWNRRLYDCRREALGLMRHIGRRALHSAQVEVLSTGWLCSQGPYRTDDLARRLEKLRAVLSRSVDRRGLWLIRQFCRAAELRSSPDLATIALALRAAIGDDIDEEKLLGDAVVSTELIALASALPETASESLADIPRPFVGRLEKLLAYIQHSGVVVTLLEDLPIMQPVGVEMARSMAHDS